MIKSKIYFILVLLTINSNISAQKDQQEDKKKFLFNGSVDSYYRANLNSANDANVEGSVPFTSFANQPGFALGMANFVVKYEGEQVGFVADFVFGPRGEDATFLSPFLRPDGSSSIVNQLYAYLRIDEKLTLTLGNFNTFLGYEVISPTGNFNYSTSYMFSNGPFSHTGLKADYAFTDDLSVVLAVMNSTDFTEFNPDGKYSFGAQLGYKGQFLNLLYGKQTDLDSFLFSEDSISTEPTFQIDYTGGFNLTNKLYMGINATYNDTSGNGFYGAALYPQLKTSEKLKIGLRGEYFGIHQDKSDNENIVAATLSVNYTVGDLTIIPELRLDSASEDFFVDGDLTPQKSISSFVLAAVYAF